MSFLVNRSIFRHDEKAAHLLCWLLAIISANQLMSQAAHLGYKKTLNLSSYATSKKGTDGVGLGQQLNNKVINK